MRENSFDVIVAAYLLNPLKSDYDYEDVAREQLGLLIDENDRGKYKGMLRSLYGIYGSRTVEPENGRNRDDEIVPGNRDAAGIYSV